MSTNDERVLTLGRVTHFTEDSKKGLLEVDMDETILAGGGIRLGERYKTIALCVSHGYPPSPITAPKDKEWKIIDFMGTFDGGATVTFLLVDVWPARTSCKTCWDERVKELERQLSNALEDLKRSRETVAKFTENHRKLDVHAMALQTRINNLTAVNEDPREVSTIGLRLTNKMYAENYRKLSEEHAAQSTKLELALSDIAKLNRALEHEKQAVQMLKKRKQELRKDRREWRYLFDVFIGELESVLEGRYVKPSLIGTLENDIRVFKGRRADLEEAQKGRPPDGA